jgi:hypothetical protein
MARHREAPATGLALPLILRYVNFEPAEKSVVGSVTIRPR